MARERGGPLFRSGPAGEKDEGSSAPVTVSGDPFDAVQSKFSCKKLKYRYTMF
jgi:hypothetical protein